MPDEGTMSSPADPHPPRPQHDYLAALLSYLLPGLGQVVQGRIGKGVLFFVCLHGLFYYGMWLGQKRNVWLPDARELPPVELPLVGKAGGLLKAVSYRPQFLGQFWIGAAAWPAVVQYYVAEPSDDGGDPPKPAPVVGLFMRAPSEAELNRLQGDGDKHWDLGWVYTVIAGVLNILVIYDALAGPMVRDDEHAPRPAGLGGSAGPRVPTAAASPAPSEPAARPAAEAVR